MLDLVKDKRTIFHHLHPFGLCYSVKAQFIHFIFKLCVASLPPQHHNRTLTRQNRQFQRKIPTDALSSVYIRTHLLLFKSDPCSSETLVCLGSGRGSLPSVETERYSNTVYSTIQYFLFRHYIIAISECVLQQNLDIALNFHSQHW